MVETRAPAFLATVIASTLLTLTIVSVRLGYRWKKKCLILSDYLIILAMITSMMHLSLDILITVKFGYGQHEANLPKNLRNSYKTGIVFWLIQIMTKLPLLFSKASVCLVYHDLFQSADGAIVRISRAVNYFTMGLTISFFSIVTLVSAFSCVPIQKIWYPTMAGKCINNNILLYVTSAINVLTSLLIICTPLPVLFRTRHKKTEVTQLIALVLLGLIDTGVSCFRLYMVGTLKDEKLDFTWIIIPAHIAIVVEYNITIIAASLIVMRPCFHAMFGCLFPNSSRRTMTPYKDYSKDRSRSRKDEHIGDQGDSGASTGITKTVYIEMTSQTGSTERILEVKGKPDFL